MTNPKKTDSDYPQDEAEKRRDELLGNLMRMPPQPRPKRDRTPAHEYVVMDGKMLVAVVTKRTDDGLVADLYRNLDDLRAGEPMQLAAELDLS